MNEEKNKSKWQRLKAFVVQDLWDVEPASMPGLPRFGVELLRIVHLVFLRFRADKLKVHASALTLATLIAIVPMLALSLSMAKGLGAGNKLLETLEERILHFEQQLEAQKPAELIPSESQTNRTEVVSTQAPDETLEVTRPTDYMRDVLKQVESADF
ncbi:MAG: hypothetical protein AAF492_09205, partial [Verrucomicrobiota bacterium]